MVFFTCNSCNEALKKNKVEKHVYTCRGCQFVTCIDCSVDFYGDDYQNHNMCITEDQKYAAKGTEFKPNKGDVKQQLWLQNIDKILSNDGNLSQKAKELISNLKNYDNIPRKRPKFLNFIKNSLRIYDTRLGEEVWSAFSAASKPPSPEMNQNSTKDPKIESKETKEELNGDVKDPQTKKKEGGSASEEVSEEPTKKKRKKDKKKKSENNETTEVEKIEENLSPKKNKKRKSETKNNESIDSTNSDKKKAKKRKKDKSDDVMKVDIDDVINKDDADAKNDANKNGVSKEVTDVTTVKKRKKKKAKQNDETNENGNTVITGNDCNGEKEVKKSKKKKKNAVNGKTESNTEKDLSPGKSLKKRKLVLEECTNGDDGVVLTKKKSKKKKLN